MADDIEFLDAEPTGDADELLPGPPSHRVLGASGRRGVVVAAVVLVAGGLIVRAATSDTSDAQPQATVQHTPHEPSSAAPTAAAPTAYAHGLSTPVDIFCGGPVPAAVPDSHVAASIAHSTLDPRRIAGLVTCASSDVAACPTLETVTSGCTTTGEIPMSVVDAVRARFPGARYVGSQSLIGRASPRLWYRYVELRADHRTSIQVLIQQRSDYAGLSGDLDNGSQLIVRSVHRGSELSTVVQVTRPSGARPDDAVAAAMAADPRLLAVG